MESGWNTKTLTYCKDCLTIYRSGATVPCSCRPKEISYEDFEKQMIDIRRYMDAIREQEAHRQQQQRVMYVHPNVKQAYENLLQADIKWEEPDPEMPF